MLTVKRFLYLSIPYLFAACFAAVWFVLSQAHKSLHLDIGFQKHITRNEWQYYLYPHKKDGSTVPNSINIVVRFAELALACLINFLVIRHVSSQFQKALARTGMGSTFEGGKWWTYANFYMCDVWDVFHSGILCTLVSGFLVSLLKVLVGEPRPDFFDRCFPTIGVTNNAAVETKLTEIVNNMTPPIKWLEICEETDFTTVNGGLLSFPSGHANNSVGGGIFVALYIWGKLGAFSPKHRSEFWRLLAGLPSIAFGLYVAATRLTDYRHHAIDIITGSAIGAVSSVVCYMMYFMPLVGKFSYLSYNQMRWCKKSAQPYENAEENEDLSGNGRKYTMVELMKMES